MENTSKTGFKFLPHGIVLGRQAAANVVEFVHHVEGFRGGRLAVGPCMCRVSPKNYPEGATELEMKDITLYYASAIYTNIPFGHKSITAEAPEILEIVHEGYIHNIFYMFGKKFGAFVMCNCDKDVCASVRATRVLGDGLNCSKGPEICLRVPEKCGVCLKRSPFGANHVKDGAIVHDHTKCMGCELCVTTCKGQAQQLGEREDCKLDHVMNRCPGRYLRRERTETKSGFSASAVMKKSKNISRKSRTM